MIVSNNSDSDMILKPLHMDARADSQHSDKLPPSFPSEVMTLLSRIKAQIPFVESAQICVAVFTSLGLISPILVLVNNCHSDISSVHCSELRQKTSIRTFSISYCGNQYTNMTHYQGHSSLGIFSVLFLSCQTAIRPRRHIRRAESLLWLFFSYVSFSLVFCD